MIRNMKPRYRFHDKVSDWQPPEAATAPQVVRELVATFPRGHVAEADDAGNVRIYRQRTIDVKLSGGVDDTRPSKLKMTLARINERNKEFWDAKNKELLK
jgi:hypothetical protein